MPNYTKEGLNQFSGGKITQRVRYQVPLIKFDGRTGNLSLVPLVNGKYGQAQPIQGSEINFTPLRARRSFFSYDKVNGESVIVWASEHNSWQDKISVFEKRGSGRVKTIDTGYISELRDKYPTLRLLANLYVLYNGEVHLLKIKGKTRQSFMSYVEKLETEGKNMFDYEVKTSTERVEGDGFPYFVLKFEATTETDPNTIGPHMEDIHNNITKMDEMFNTYANDEKKTVEEELETIQLEEEEESNKIDPASVPF